MAILTNPFRARGIPGLDGAVSQDPTAVLRLLSRCPEAAPTVLRSLPSLASELPVDRLWVKDESSRMGLGSFKALGAAYLIAAEAAESETGRLDGVTYVAASAGNHGLSLAAGARTFGAKGVVFISENVREHFADRLEAQGAEVVRAGADYEESMAAAARAAEEKGWRLLSDSSWPGYSDVPHKVMEGYLAIGAEIADQLEGGVPTHVFLQAGVGGLAAALAGFVRRRWGDDPKIVVVEPETARPLLESIRAGEPVRADGPPSVMGRLDCKKPSHLALGALARWADVFMTVTDSEAEDAARRLAAHGVDTTPSGAAGFAGLCQVDRAVVSLDSDSRVLTVASEGP